MRSVMERTSVTPHKRERVRKRSSQDTRALMLEAGERVLHRLLRDPSDDAAGAPLAHIRLTDVAREATAIVGERGDARHRAVTTGSIYQLWPSQAAFQADLVRHIITATTFPEASQLQAVMLELFAGGATLREIIDRLSEVSFQSNATESFFARLGFLQYAVIPSIGDALQDNVHLFDELDRPIFDAILTYTRRRVREPFTLEDLWVTAEALIAGFLIRQRVDPDALRWSLPPEGRSVLSHAVEGAFLAFTEPIDDDEQRLGVAVVGE
jgi:hypothetical protein